MVKYCSDNNPNHCANCELRNVAEGWCQLYVHEPAGACYKNDVPSFIAVRAKSQPIPSGKAIFHISR